MKRCRIFLLVVLCLPLVQLTLAQTSRETASSLPRLVRFGGTVTEPNGTPMTGVAGVTFTLYSEQTGGAPLWMETQNVTADANGRYSALLGATQSGGLPAELFTSEQARWVGVQVQGQPEQPRVLLVSAPYALKAVDAETVGGLPPSAFVLAAAVSAGTARSDATPNAAIDVTTTGGTANYLPFFNGASTIVDSLLYQSATGEIGINTSAPAATLDVNGDVAVSGAISTGACSTFAGLSLPALGAATASVGDESHSLKMAASVFNSGTSAAVAETFELKAEPVGNNTAAPNGVLNPLFGSGTNTPGETGLQFARNGQITFATGQSFPGTGAGTITGVTAGAGLSGGGSSGNVTLANTGLLGLTAGTGIAIGNGQTPTVSVSSAVPLLTTSNTFTGSQTVTGSTYTFGDTRVDYKNRNTGTVSPGVRFGGGETGEGISSDRTGTANPNGIDLYTAFVPRLSLTNAGFVGIGTTAPAYALDVRGTGNFLSTVSIGLTGTTSAAAFSGVNGNNTATSGASYGVAGTTESPAGAGTYGVNLSIGGYGVFGESIGANNNSTGVYGAATAASGREPTYGVYGSSDSRFLQGRRCRRDRTRPQLHRHYQRRGRRSLGRHRRPA
jgi:hypothetical protein